jgi:alpha-glucosidase
VTVPRRDGTAMVAAMREFTASFGWGAVCSSWNILGSHDSPRIRTTTGSADLHHVAAVLQFTLPGVPMVFAGDELGLEGVDGEDSRKTMPWDDPEAFRTRTSAVYAALAGLRSEHVALRRGGMRWVHVGADEVAFLREHPDETLLVVATRTGATEPDLPGIDRGERLLQVGDSGRSPRATLWSVR